MSDTRYLDTGSYNISNVTQTSNGNNNESALVNSPTAHAPNSKRHAQNFVLAEHPATSDEMLKSQKVTDLDIVYVYNEEDNCYQQAIHMSSLYENRLSNLKYLLTSVPPPNIDAQDSDGYTAIRAAVCNNNHRALKLLIDFDADRSIVSNQSRTPLEDAEIRGKRECAKLLKDYFPSRDDKLKIQLECKNFIDKLLEFKGRFNQGNVDIFYTAVKEEVDADFKKLNDNGQLSTGGSSKKSSTQLVQIETERLRMEQEKALLKEERLRMEAERKRLKDERVRWEFEKVKLEIEREAWEEERKRLGEIRKEMQASDGDYEVSLDFKAQSK